MSDKKIILVTGASRGIGRAIAGALAAEGHTVVGTATSQAGADAIAKDLKAHSPSSGGLALNLNDSSNLSSTLEAMVATYGSPDVLVNNAGITRDNLFLRIKPEELQAVIDTNLLSVMKLTQLAIKAMVKKRWGRIINIGSVVGSTGNPGQTNYAAAKAGLVGFANSLAQEIASRGITVNTVAPGFIDTDMTASLSESQRETILNKVPMKRLGQPHEIAHLVSFLASDKAKYITGQTLHVNGGMYMTG